MSETVNYRGKLVQLRGKGNIEDVFLQNVNYEVKLEYNDYIERCNLRYEDATTKVEEFIENELYQQYYIDADELIWKIVKEEVDPDEDFFKAEFGDSQYEINFDVKYYNGGCSLDEALDHAIANIGEEKL